MTDNSYAAAALYQQPARHAEELAAYEVTVANRDTEIANLRGKLATHAAQGLAGAFDGLGAGRKALKHDFFRPGDADCPDEIKAPNGELHTLFCRNCGDYWRHSREACLPAAPAPEPEREPMHEGEIQAAWLGQDLDEPIPYTFVLGIRSAERFNGIKEKP